MGLLKNITVHAIDSAAYAGHLHTVQLLSHYDAPATKLAMDNAARNGHMDVVQWLYNNRHEGFSWNAVFAAYRNGHYDIVRWLLSKPLPEPLTMLRSFHLVSEHQFEEGSTP